MRLRSLLMYLYYNLIPKYKLLLILKDIIIPLRVIRFLCVMFILFHIIVPDPIVSTLVTPNSELNNHTFESGMVSLECFVIITSLDVDTNVNITWFEPNGVVVHDNTRYSIDTGQLNSTVYGSSLNISDLSLTGDNGTQYYCRAQVGANDSFIFSSFIIPSEATSENVTVIVEGTYIRL